MPLAAGTRLGPYEVLGLIGAGGMGEVYKARDTRLDRTVAIKILPAELNTDSERRVRFEREARAIASLTDPHICTLHDVGEHDGATFLVMEHLAGETLADRLRMRPLPLEQALTVATEIADALAAAHRQGVIHRDLKPGNVMLTKSGAKLLDFGLAKLAGHGGRPALAGDAAAPTMTAPVTARGTILGTLQYMAPEQLEGKEADARTDLWALGAILYEMLTGRRAFKGESQATIISAIMSSQPPPPSAIEAVTPLAVDRLVQRCLTKDPDGRWQTATDLAEALRWVSTDSGSRASVAARAGPRTVGGRRWRWVVAPAVLLSVAAVVVWWLMSARPVPVAPPPAKHTQVTFIGNVSGAALTQDGRTIAYTVRDRSFSGTIRLMIRDIEGSEALEIWRCDEASGDPAWMPDGREVLISDGTAAWLVPRFGGTARRVEELKDLHFAVAPSPDGSAIAYSSKPGYQVLFLASGKTLSRSVPGANFVHALSWNRTGDELALVATTEDRVSGVWIATPASGNTRRLPQAAGENLYGACWSPVADVLYVQRARGRTTEVVRMTFLEHGQVDEEPLLTGIFPSGSCQVSEDGQRLLHVRSIGSSNLWRLDLAHSGNPTPLTTGTWALRLDGVSADGRWVLATSVSDVMRSELMRIPAGGGPPAPFVAKAQFGTWSPDGRRLAFVSSRSGSKRVWVADSDGGNAVEVPGSEVGTYQNVFWWPDGRLAWQKDVYNFRIRNLTTGRDDLLRADSAVGGVSEPRVSPSGRQVAAYVNGPNYGLRLVTLPDRRERLLAPGGLFPIAWTPDGLFIYAHRAEPPEVVRVSVATGAVQSVGRFPMGAIDRCSMTPDRAAIVCSLLAGDSDAWVVDHFDPHVPPTKC